MSIVGIYLIATQSLEIKNTILKTALKSAVSPRSCEYDISGIKLIASAIETTVGKLTREFTMPE